jgi:acyl carrier protein
MTARDSLLHTIRAIVERVAGPSRTPPHSGPGTALSEGGYWLDSVELLEVVVACESEFSIAFDPRRDLNRETVATLGTLTELVRAKRLPVHPEP